MKVAPLSGSFMITAIIGLLIALMFLPQYSMNWAIIVGVISFAMLIASVISMTKAPVEEELALDGDGAKKRVEHTDNSDLRLFPKKKK